MSVALKDFLEVMVHPRSIASESYRSLRTNLQGAMGQGLKSVGIVSSWAGEGKSMVCANLAAAFAQLFFEVVLIDGDMRRPTLSRVTGTTKRKGLAEYLCQDPEALDYESLLVPTDIKNLTFLPAGEPVGNPADMLAGNRISELLDSLAVKNRFVVLDSPPLSACSDALMLGTRVSGVVLIVNPERWRGDIELRLKQSLLQHKVNVLGMVINNSDLKDTGYGYGYGAGYGYGYGYGSSAGYGEEPVAAEQSTGKLFPWWGK